MSVLVYQGYKKGDTVFLNGKRLTINSIEPEVHHNGSSKFIYIDTQEQGVVAMPIWQRQNIEKAL